MIDNIETRLIEVREIELRASVDPNSRRISGTAVVFDELSEDLGGFKEMILSGSITQELLNKSDIVLLYNHNEENGVLARSRKGKGTLTITLSPKSIDFSFVAKKTAFGDEILESVRCGDLNACSFAFRKAPNGDSIQRQSDGSYLRKLSSIDLIKDFSIVVDGAYSTTSVDVRSLEQFKANEVISEENNIDETNKCDMDCGKCDQIIAQNERILELIQKMIVEDVIEDLVETLEEPVVEETPVPEVEPASEPMVEDMNPEMETRSLNQDEELKKYYEDLKISIKSIKIE